MTGFWKTPFKWGFYQKSRKIFQKTGKILSSPKKYNKAYHNSLLSQPNLYHMKRIHLFVALFILVLLSACKPNVIDDNIPEEPIGDITQLSVPDDFNYATTQSLALTLKAVDNSGRTLINIPFSIYQKEGDSTWLLLKGMIGKDGVYKEMLTLDANATELLLYTAYPGLPAIHHLTINNSSLYYTMGADNVIGFKGTPGDHELQNPVKGIVTSKSDPGIRKEDITVRSNTIKILGTYTSQGKPNYLEADDIVKQDLLDLIAANLPEYQPVPTYHPEYIANDVKTSVSLKENADVWVTFVTEGAGFRNTLGYYVYDTNNPPQTADDIDTLYVIFPNVSFNGSGGALNTGNKVKLGRFQSGKTIGWFLMPDAWNGSTVSPRTGQGYETKFSDRQLNTFTANSYRNHMVLLQDPARELLLLGFEDTSRPGGDQDFNDAIFYVTANPYTAVDTDQVVETKPQSNDHDGDGVADNNDDFPNDPELAFITYAPGQQQQGTLAFEDLWPVQGDYDMNDVVVNYNFIEYRNAANKIAAIHANFTLRALGAGMQSGFAFELPIPAASVKSVSGTQLLSNYIHLLNNGVEAGQNNAVIIVFDNGHKIMPPPPGGFVNTVHSATYVTTVRIELVIELQEPVSSNILGAAPYNPFIIAGGRRGYEIHLPDHAPTDLADVNILGTSQDDSDAGKNRYYKTHNNLPWAINIPESFNYPIEKSPIHQAYKKFAEWATSGGKTQKNWYKTGNGTRNDALIY